jgi:hypothetical protein
MIQAVSIALMAAITNIKPAPETPSQYPNRLLSIITDVTAIALTTTSPAPRTAPALSVQGAGSIKRATAQATAAESKATDAQM